MTGSASDEEIAEALQGSSAEVVATLLENHRRFLDFLTARVGDRALAEEILQDAFVRGIERADTVRSNESAVAWFFRLLRNAVIDHQRRAASPIRSAGELLPELERAAEDPASAAEVCRCILGLAGTLKPEYAAVLQRVDVEGRSVQDFAADVGITANNASVRLFRAREALKKRVDATCRTCATHGCLDCTCGPTCA
jgi:RNA polymerase sigma-70 factor (ECF subfamily)